MTPNYQLHWHNRWDDRGSKNKTRRSEDWCTGSNTPRTQTTPNKITMKITKYSDYRKWIKRFMKENNIQERHLVDDNLTPTIVGRYFQNFTYNPEPTLKIHNKIVQRLCAITGKTIIFEHDIFAIQSQNE